MTTSLRLFRCMYKQTCNIITHIPADLKVHRIMMVQSVCPLSIQPTAYTNMLGQSIEKNDNPLALFTLTNAVPGFYHASQPINATQCSISI